MARKSQNGKWIITAGEVAEYAVCPEAWRLSLQARSGEAITKINSKTKHTEGKHQVRSLEGMELHKNWALNLTEAMSLLRGVRFVLLLSALALLVFVITFGGFHA
jgi:hypothetical protein